MKTKAIEKIITAYSHGCYNPFIDDRDVEVAVARDELTALQEDNADQQLTIEYLSDEVENATELIKQHKEKDARLQALWGMAMYCPECGKLMVEYPGDSVGPKDADIYVANMQGWYCPSCYADKGKGEMKMKAESEGCAVKCALCGAGLRGDVDTWPGGHDGYVCPRCYEVWNRSCCESPIKPFHIWQTLKDLVYRARENNERNVRLTQAVLLGLNWLDEVCNPDNEDLRIPEGVAAREKILALLEG